MADRPKKNPLLNLILSGVDELELFPTREDRLKAIEAYSHSLRGWPIVAQCVIAGLLVVPINLGAKMVIRWLAPNLNRELLDLLVFLVMMSTALLILRWLHRRNARRELRSKLIACGVPVCVGCGYLLRGLPPETQQCPECGEPIDDQVHILLNPSEPGADTNRSVMRLE